jgi:hypothetical protein
MPDAAHVAVPVEGCGLEQPAAHVLGAARSDLLEVPDVAVVQRLAVHDAQARPCAHVGMEQVVAGIARRAQAERDARAAREHRHGRGAEAICLRHRLELEDLQLRRLTAERVQVALVIERDCDGLVLQARGLAGGGADRRDHLLSREQRRVVDLHAGLPAHVGAGRGQGEPLLIGRDGGVDREAHQADRHAALRLALVVELSHGAGRDGLTAGPIAAGGDHHLAILGALVQHPRAAVLGGKGAPR